jgi:ribulose-phosphate 3-epimerase
MIGAIKISSSILNADFLHLEDQVAIALQSGSESIHMDVMDGNFVPNISFGAFLVEALSPMVHTAGAQVYVHLMIEEPERYIPAFVMAGADLVVVHVESVRDLVGTLKGIHTHGARAGLTLRPKTPLLSIQAGLPLADLILIMTVEPGFGGQAFQPEGLVRIRRVRELLDGLQTGAELAVDGGITTENACQVAEAGASTLVVGQAVFRAGKPIPDAIRELREAAQKGVLRRL